MDYSIKYLKYKKKYLKLKNKLSGGLLVSSEDLTFKCRNSRNNSIYLPEKCTKEFPCYSYDGKCYALQPDSFKREITNEDFLKKLYPEKFDNIPVFIFFESFSKIGNEENPFSKNSYLLGDKLGKGVFGKVYSLFNIDLDLKNIALKLYTIPVPINLIFSKFKVQRDLCLKSDIINKIYDYGVYNLMFRGNPVPFSKSEFNNEKSNDFKHVYLAMEQCKGGELFNRLQLISDYYKKNKIDGTYYFNKISIYKKLITNILTGVKVIHDNGYVHLDLKLENIGMVEPFEISEELLINLDPNIEEEINSKIKILDFDFLSKINSKTNIPLGSTVYMAPEFYYNKNELYNLGIKDDMYSIGIIMYASLFQELPFKYSEKRVENKNFTRNMNELQEKYPDLLTIIRSLLSEKEEDRPNCDTVLNSSFFTS